MQQFVGAERAKQGEPLLALVTGEGPRVAMLPSVPGEGLRRLEHYAAVLAVSPAVVGVGGAVVLHQVRRRGEPLTAVAGQQRAHEATDDLLRAGRLPGSSTDPRLCPRRAAARPTDVAGEQGGRPQPAPAVGTAVQTLPARRALRFGPLGREPGHGLEKVSYDGDNFTDITVQLLGKHTECKQVIRNVGMSQTSLVMHKVALFCRLLGIRDS